MKDKNKMVIVSGLALFSMFFGAGNLIFPPTLGHIMGSKYIYATIGFTISAVGLVMLGVIATTKSGGNIENIGAKLGRKFSILFGTMILLAIGPGLAIPRTAATTYEVVQISLLPNLSPLISSIVFFGIVLAFAFNPSSIIDSLGKILTPVLLFLLAVIIIKGFLNPFGTPSEINIENAFGRSFEEGYQTMDALAALVFTPLIISGFRSRGIKDDKQLVSHTIKAGIIASIGLIIVYGGLLYIGATTSYMDLGEKSKVPLLITITGGLLGNIGNIALSAIMALACLTTAIGLTTTVGTFFSKALNNKLSYKTVVIISTVFSAYFAIMGVESIVTISATVLSELYPVAIVLIVLNLFPELFNKKSIYIGSVSGAFIPSLIKLMNYIGGHLPESYQSFIWIVPVVVLGGLYFVLDEKENTIVEIN